MLIFTRIDSISRFLAVLLLLFAPVSAVARLDTISLFDDSGGYSYYQDPSITMQAARFDLEAPAHIRRLSLLIGGRSDKGTITIRLFGHEGGLPAPGLERDIMPPIIVAKSRPGIERIVVDIPGSVHITTSQFFVAVENLSPELFLVSDRITRSPSCRDISGDFYYQLLRTGTSRWTWGKFAFAIDVEVDYHERTRDPYLVNVTPDLRINDSISCNRSIAWTDLDGDSYIDLLVGGKLYRNERGESFRDITTASGLTGQPMANVFIDVDNDGDRDVLFIDEEMGENGTLFVNDGSGRFVAKAIDLGRRINPTSISIADADGDGYLDIFIGGLADKTSDTLGYKLLINNRGLSFTDRSDLLRAGSRMRLSAGSQWTDVDGDGELDLFVVNGESGWDGLWTRQKDSTFGSLSAETKPIGVDDPVTGNIGCHWLDYDNDGDVDLLLPSRVPLASARGLEDGIHPVMAHAGSSERQYYPATIQVEYEQKQAGGAWADVNNDGNVDFILATSCGCRFGRLYLQNEDHSFTSGTYDAGLYRASLGPDVTWIDYDNDGRLDLSTFLDGRPIIYRNSHPDANQFLLLDLEGPHATGARATVHTGDVQYTREVTSGRGLLMQDPMRLHFGLGGAGTIDSVTVRWSNGRVERFTGIEPRSIHKITEGGAWREGKDSHGRIVASPNPFSTRLQLNYSLAIEDRVTLTIHAVDGSIVRSLVDDTQQPGDYQIFWDGRDGKGEKASQGTYIYRLSTSNGDATGKVVMAR